jgi:hypothetical protein
LLRKHSTVMWKNKHWCIVHIESVWSNISLGKLITYRSCIESCYSFIELAGMHLVLGKYNGNTTDAVVMRKYRENYPNRRVPNCSAFLSVDCRLRKMTIFHRMGQGSVAVHVLYVHVDLGASPRGRLKISTSRLVACASALPHTVHYKNITFILISFSLCTS